MEGQFIQEGNCIDYTAVAACQQGDVVLCPGGFAGVVAGNISAAQVGAVQVKGVVKLPKTASIYLLPGGDAYWDVSAGKVNFAPDAGTNDFYLGVITADATSSDTYCYVDLNKRTHHIIDIQRGDQEWTSAITNAATLAVYPGNTVRANLVSTSEAECVTVISRRTVLISHKPILEARINRIASTTSAVDIDVGLASGVSTTDFEAVTAFAAIHLDGGDNNISYHSDDNTTDRAVTDSTVDDVTGTPFEVWIDARDDTNVKFYVNGVAIDSSGAKGILTAALTTAVGAVISIEKTTGTATAEVQVSKLRVRHQAE